MSVIVEFTVAAEDFQLGEVLSGDDNMELELERVVPTGHMMMPFVWATGGDHGAFEDRVRDHPAVKELLLLDKVQERALYRIEWEETPTDLIDAISRSEAIVMEAQGNGEWRFRLRFPDHGKLSEFHNFVIEESIPLHIDRTYTLREETGEGRRFGLTAEQREALVLALRRGYFATPREVDLDEIAAELEISRQAVSDRIRLGNEAVLRKSLLSSAADRD